MVDSPAITEYLEAALKGTTLRQKVIANNIANLSTPGFRRGVARFENHLARAIADGRSIDLDALSDIVIQPKNTPVDFRGNDVNLEVEIGEMIKNTTMYKTYLRLLNRVYRQMELAMRDK